MNYKGAYNSNRTLLNQSNKRKREEGEEEEEEENFAIFECNSDCCCTYKCSNRVVQLGIQISLQLFKSKNKGWGLMTLEELKKGQFVCEYVGEIINLVEAKKRQCEYDKVGLNYLMVIREFSGNRILRTNIDSTFRSNVAKFINHSCDPNLELQLVRIQSLLPRVGLFTKKEISANTELTFDYGSIEEENIGSKYPCHCGSYNCKKFLPFNPNV